MTKHFENHENFRLILVKDWEIDERNFIDRQDESRKNEKFVQNTWSHVLQFNKNKMPAPTIKSRFYKEYRWPKCSTNLYYQRLREWYSQEEAIQPKPRTWNRIERWPYAEEMTRRKEYEWKKPWRAVFYERIRKWYSKEESIKIDFWRHIKEKVQETPKKKQKTTAYWRPPKQYSWIDITMNLEEWKVFKDEFENQIERIKVILSYSEELEEIKKIESKLKLLLKEYEIFKKYNPLLFKKQKNVYGRW